MLTSDFDYHLPEELIASHPAARRDEARLLALGAADAAPRHLHVSDLPNLLRAGDLLVVNDTRVIPARLLGRRAPGGGRIEVLLVRPTVEKPGGEATSAPRWEVLVRPGKKVHAGDRIVFEPGAFEATVVGHRSGPGERVLEFLCGGGRDLRQWIEAFGKIPLPPYILRRRQCESGERLTYPWDDHLSTSDDRERYQTVYARDPGSIAAPTAGLHFTPELLRALEARGVERTSITLHIGPGTFQKVETENPAEHVMHEEEFEVEREAADAIERARREGRRIVAVGTTVVRVLEHLARENAEKPAAALKSGPGAAYIPDGGGAITPGRGATRLFILPGYNFRVVDAMLTNFHLPRSTLLMLICAFAGRERVLAAYEEAIRQRYRFYSYGDATFLERLP